jgi:hypothetical protein
MAVCCRRTFSEDQFASLRTREAVSVGSDLVGRFKDALQTHLPERRGPASAPAPLRPQGEPLFESENP